MVSESSVYFNSQIIDVQYYFAPSYLNFNYRYNLTFLINESIEKNLLFKEKYLENLEKVLKKINLNIKKLFIKEFKKNFFYNFIFLFF